MDEQPDKTGGRPRFLNNMTAMIGGATALVVAIGGLVTAARTIWHDEPAVETRPPVVAAPSEESSAPVEEEEGPTSYTTADGGTLRWVQGMWVWTDGEGNTYRYTLEEDDGTTSTAVLRGGGENGEDVWLRWPNAGGMASESTDSQENWKDLGKVTPEEK